LISGVTLGGTGKEAGDRHPKVGHGVILQSSSAVLGNIPVGDGAVIMAKSIVTKPVPALALVSGVPARVVSTRDLDFDRLVQDDLQHHLAIKYLPKWLEIAKQQEEQNALEKAKEQKKQSQ
jgi:serine acetyltransferase